MKLVNSKSSVVIVIILILVLASFLRFYWLDHSDVINDEAIIGFRSIGYIDFFSSPYQTTPWEWFSDVPAWARLSFHDHPPLTFAVQFLFFKLLGQNIIALRLPFVLAGIGSVWLLYFIGRELFDKSVGIIASLLMAVSSYHVWVSRTGLQESLVIFFSLLTLFLLLHSFKDNRHWTWGIALGLAMLTKYTTFILMPAFIFYLAIFKREILKNKKFWLAIILALVIFSPVILYNIKLYQTRGHFDLQFSYLLGQRVNEWQSLPGKEQAGDFGDRIKNLIPAVYNGFLWPIFSLLVLSLVYFGYYSVKYDDTIREEKERLWLVIIMIVFYSLFLLLIGPSPRFVSLLIPFIILLVAWLVSKFPKIFRVGLIASLMIIEIFFSYNTLLAYNPIGQKGITYSYLNVENYNWGYNQLDRYLDQILAGKKPSFSLETKYKFLEEIRKKSLNQAKNKQDFAVLLIYDPNFYDLATFWTFHRRLVYEGWPVVTADTYLSQDQNFWQSQKISDFYFFKIRDLLILSQSVLQLSDSADILSSQLEGVTPEIIKRPDGREIFEVYHWNN